MSETWSSYRCHKVVRAAVITHIVPDDIPSLFIDGGGDPKYTQFIPSEEGMARRARVGDYVVDYGNGYKSVSPKEVFEAGYSKVEDATS